MQTYVTVEEARETILGSVRPLGEASVLLDDAVGLRAAETIRAPADLPPFDNSSRDGYAIRYRDVQETPDRELDVVDTSAAGDAADTRVEEGEAARILTGAPLPEGADTVVMQEHVEILQDGGVIRLEQMPEGPGAWIRKAGRYLKSGETVLRPGDAVAAPEIGMLASFGRSTLSVRRTPKVAIVTAGDELVDVDEVPGPDEIVDSNRYQVSALIEDAGFEAVRIPRASDEVVDVRRAFKDAVRSADVVVSVGGVSVGDRDVVRTVLDEITGGLDVYRVRMKPGKPLAFGVATDDRATPLIGLPGNPNSCFVCFHQFVRPMLQVMAGAGADQIGLPSFTATLATDTTSPSERREYQAGVLVRPDERSEDGLESAGAHGRPSFRPVSDQSSGDPSLFCGMNAFGIVPEGIDEMKQGDPIAVELLGPQ